MDNKFFNFALPYFNAIDRGSFFRSPFSWLYILLAFINLAYPFYLLYQGVNYGVFSHNVAAFFAWLVLAFAGWICFQLFWNRRSMIHQSSYEGAEFVATPAFAHFFQTMGEWYGTFIGIVGCGISLIGTLSDGYLGIGYFGINDILPFGNLSRTSFIGIIMFPLVGFLIITITRFLSETFKSLSAIANNTGVKSGQSPSQPAAVPAVETAPAPVLG